ncbi:phage virion morphogenesis protein [Rhodobacter aestuarii]|uniref:Phage virion morphogenesis (Putative tail completion) protein n=1 Tax=Rhodobacter aestuarii TaxID=453582 RepID=A0A1N7Q1K4_9RHOB|nr:phage virion morphogenesis protein [Rhodobacter aestuarii]PTV94028.1 phage virion morphogenesis protein [Rhodobacter aestuarii]SIT16748.1 phage virion morphogenesis (putative tail completion) protein [Rhodobacter aestuarii]
MAGISIKVELQDLAARDTLRDLLTRMENPQPFYASVGERLLSSTRDRFETQTDPQGAPWVSLAPRTIKQRQKRGQLPLTILRSNSKGMAGSSLAGSINYIASAEEVRIGSPKVYAAIHQLGGTIQKPESSRYMVGRRFAKRSEEGGREVKIKAHTITIPARPYIGISPEDEIGILEDAEDWLSQ